MHINILTSSVQNIQYTELSKDISQRKKKNKPFHCT